MFRKGRRGQEKEEGPAAGSDAGQESPGRWDVSAIRGRRAFYTTFEVLRVALIVLGVLALALFALAEFLALQSPPDRAHSFKETSAALLSATVATDTPQALTSAPTPAISPTATSTPRPTSTPTFVPTVTRRPKPTPTVPTATPELYPAPTLLEPADGATPSQRAVFKWQWNGPPLAIGQAFELRVWSAQEEQAGLPRRGATGPTMETQVEVDLEYVPAIQDNGPGDYYWTVVVVEMQPDGRVGRAGKWGESRRFVYR